MSNEKPSTSMALATTTLFLPIVVDIRDDDRERIAAVLATVLEHGAVTLRPGEEATLVLRAADADPSLTGVPLLTYGTGTRSTWQTALPTPEDQAAFAAALAPWVDRGAAFVRTAALVGDAALAPMAARLAEELDRFVSTDDHDPFEAHKLGGFAGTLGFRRFAHCAERLAQRDASYRRAALREAEWAAAIVHGYLRNWPGVTTLV